MPECPLINAPLQPEEEPILEKLSSIRVRLEILKRDRSTYVKSCDVVPLYDELIEQVEQLNQVRKDMPKRQNRGISTFSRPKDFNLLDMNCFQCQLFGHANGIKYHSGFNITCVFPTHVSGIPDHWQTP